jgi:hypothetical protein
MEAGGSQVTQWRRGGSQVSMKAWIADSGHFDEEPDLDLYYTKSRVICLRSFDASNLNALLFFDFSEAEAKHLVFESDQDQDNQLTKVRHLFLFFKIGYFFRWNDIVTLQCGCMMPLLLKKHLKNQSCMCIFPV